MKVFNLTDVESPALKQRGLVNQTIAVGDQMMPPGGVAEIDDETWMRVQPSLQVFVTLGAMAVNELPANYKVAKAKANPQVPPRSDGSAALSDKKTKE